MQKDLTLFGQFASALRNADLDIAIVDGGWRWEAGRQQQQTLSYPL